jgi:hypothetical protein
VKGNALEIVLQARALGRELATREQILELLELS